MLKTIETFLQSKLKINKYVQPNFCPWLLSDSKKKQPFVGKIRGKFWLLAAGMYLKMYNSQTLGFLLPNSQQRIQEVETSEEGEGGHNKNRKTEDVLDAKKKRKYHTHIQHQ